MIHTSKILIPQRNDMFLEAGSRELRVLFSYSHGNFKLMSPFWVCGTTLSHMQSSNQEISPTDERGGGGPGTPVGVISAVGRGWPTDGGPSQPIAYRLGRWWLLPWYVLHSLVVLQKRQLPSVPGSAPSQRAMPSGQNFLHVLPLLIISPRLK